MSTAFRAKPTSPRLQPRKAPAGLLGYWAFHEPSSSVRDLAGAGRDLALGGLTSWVASPTGPALATPLAATAPAQVPHTPAFVGLADFTFAMRFTVRTVSSGRFLGGCWATNTNRVFSLSAGAGNVFVGGLSANGGAVRNVTGTTAFAAGETYTLLLTRTASAIVLSLDGRVEATDDWGNPLFAAPASPLTLGHISNPSGSGNASAIELHAAALLGRGLTAAEALDLHHDWSTGTFSALRRRRRKTGLLADGTPVWRTTASDFAFRNFHSY